MGQDDLLVYDCKPDTLAARQCFDVGTNNVVLSQKYRFMLELLNIDSSLYEVESGYDEQKRMRYIRVRLNTTITINFESADVQQSVLLEKGDTILLLRVWHQTAIETINEFEKVGFEFLYSTMTKKREGLLTIFAIGAKSDYTRP
jgi:hypothetical protein